MAQDGGLCSAWPATLLILLVLSGGNVLSQEVRKHWVSTAGLEVSWERDGRWVDVEDFSVSLVCPAAAECFKVVTCTVTFCSFNSVEECDPLPACCNVSVTISGGSHTAPALSLVTAPEAATNLVLELTEGVEYISWDNPMPETSPCYNETLLRVSYNDVDTTTKHSATEESVSLPLCVPGKGRVEVRTMGGDGSSDVTFGRFEYRAADYVPLVRIEACEAVGCSTLEVAWVYNRQCPGMRRLLVQYDDVDYVEEDIKTTSVNITSLASGESYKICVLVLGRTGRSLDEDCRTCKTQPIEVEDLQVEAKSTMSLKASWLHPECDSYEEIVYAVSASPASGGRAVAGTTFELTYEWGNLQPMSTYDVCVQVKGSQNPSVCTYASTPPTSPRKVSAERVDDRFLRVSWNWDGDVELVLFRVLWGAHLENTAMTSAKSCTLDQEGSNGTRVCVAAMAKLLENATSGNACIDVSPDNPGASRQEEAVVIVGVVAGLLAATVVVGVAVTVVRQRREQRRRLERFDYHQIHPSS